MTDFVSEINYDKLIEQALKQVVVDALKIAELQGLPGENHFYITFKTDHPETIIPKDLKIQYPESMTIVLQHQYSNLVVTSDSFSVELSFGGRLQTLIIPFDAITYFADPYAKFGLSFSFYENGDVHSLDDIEPEKKVSGETAQIISFDSFRKKQ
ncbi:MAG: hypothetical protein J6B00_01020 [Alphaproteobacteria bacterium]|nr:hypothetical protein [Alphaproteobacteria bacterium]MBO5440982.1 hypothetical protein [Alphaproteobacteria bacterium]MBP3686885.1 hypothetical protein [Alphaproteobacteria bacterium]